MNKNFDITQALLNLEHALCTLDGLIVTCKDYNLKQCLLKMDNNLYYVKEYLIDHKRVNCNIQYEK